MASPFAERFMRTLQQVEQSGDPGPLADMFADDAELTNLTLKEPRRGKDGARQFWADYLAAFGSVRSRFGHVVEGEAGAAMEWVSEGTLPNGRPIRYRGISVVEPAAGAGGRVAKFRTYYDSAAFVAAPADAEPADG